MDTNWWSRVCTLDTNWRVCTLDTNWWSRICTLDTNWWSQVCTLDINWWSQVCALDTNSWSQVCTLHTNWWSQVPTLNTNSWSQVCTLNTNWWSQVPTLNTTWWSQVCTLDTNWWSRVWALGTNWWPQVCTLNTNWWSQVRTLDTRCTLDTLTTSSLATGESTVGPLRALGFQRDYFNTDHKADQPSATRLFVQQLGRSSYKEMDSYKGSIMRKTFPCLDTSPWSWGRGCWRNFRCLLFSSLFLICHIWNVIRRI